LAANLILVKTAVQTSFAIEAISTFFPTERY